MYLRDHPLLNTLRRLRGWTPGDRRLMVEARDDRQHFFLVYEVRAETLQAAEAVVSAALAEDGVDLVEIAQDRPASVPMPKNTALIALSDRIYFGDTALPSGPSAPQKAEPR